MGQCFAGWNIIPEICNSKVVEAAEQDRKASVNSTNFTSHYTHTFFLKKEKVVTSLCSKNEQSQCVFILRNWQKQPPRLFSKISVLFFQEQLFLYFSRRLYVFTEQMPIFQEGLSVRRTDTNFPGGLGLFTEQLPFFQEPSLCVHRTDTDFPGAIF